MHERTRRGTVFSCAKNVFKTLMNLKDDHALALRIWKEMLGKLNIIHKLIKCLFYVLRHSRTIDDNDNNNKTFYLQKSYL